MLFLYLCQGSHEIFDFLRFDVEAGVGEFRRGDPRVGVEGGCGVEREFGLGEHIGGEFECFVVEEAEWVREGGVFGDEVVHGVSGLNFVNKYLPW